jgi:hypothetical protein
LRLEKNPHRSISKKKAWKLKYNYLRYGKYQSSTIARYGYFLNYYPIEKGKANLIIDLSGNGFCYI